MALLVAPLTIVTTRDADGRHRGFTASSVISVSLEPPLVLVGISHTSSCFVALAEAPEFLINLLGDQHRDVARKFAARGVDRFAGQDFDTWPNSELPYLTDANAVFRCSTVDRIRVGDHDLLIGELTEVRTNRAVKPLLWYQREFHTPA